ncbi:hypothetical protein V8B97DRAFT_874188 [Scleroderma yunnanense]
MSCWCASMSNVLSTVLGERLGMGGSGFSRNEAGLAGTSDGGRLLGTSVKCHLLDTQYTARTHMAMETQIWRLMVASNTVKDARTQNFIFLYITYTDLHRHDIHQNPILTIAAAQNSPSHPVITVVHV